MRKAHAEHNEQACEYIFKDGRFNDWVVTTAFYSALHYVQHKIFPLNIGGQNFYNLNSYYSSIVKGQHANTNKHQTLVNLVANQIPSIAGNYRWLYNICMTARYNDYNITHYKATKARNTLVSIKEACVSEVHN